MQTTQMAKKRTKKKHRTAEAAEQILSYRAGKMIDRCPLCRKFIRATLTLTVEDVHLTPNEEASFQDERSNGIGQFDPMLDCDQYVELWELIEQHAVVTCEGGHTLKAMRTRMGKGTTDA